MELRQKYENARNNIILKYSEAYANWQEKTLDDWHSDWTGQQNEVNDKWTPALISFAKLHTNFETITSNMSDRGYILEKEEVETPKIKHVRHRINRLYNNVFTDPELYKAVNVVKETFFDHSQKGKDADGHSQEEKALRKKPLRRRKLTQKKLPIPQTKRKTTMKCVNECLNY